MKSDTIIIVGRMYNGNYTPMFDDINLGVSRHAIDRFRERVDPTATSEQVIRYVRQSTPIPIDMDRMERENIDPIEHIARYGDILLRYLHVTFVAVRRRGKGARQIVVVTCY